MTTNPWQRTCKRCGRSFEVALWCREVAYCDSCQAELDGKLGPSLDDRATPSNQGLDKENGRQRS